jgi:hypothetical protein
VLFVLTFAVWGGGYVLQRGYTRSETLLREALIREAASNGDTIIVDSLPENLQVHDWTYPGYIGPMFLYMAYGFYDAAWQTCVYWYVLDAFNSRSTQLIKCSGSWAP